MWNALVALLALSTPAQAADCDAKALQKTLTEASPAGAGKAWTELAACDEAAAKKVLPATLERMIENEGAWAAATEAIRLGQGAKVRGWVHGLQAPERSRTLAYLGDQCAVDQVDAFFLDALAADAERFWGDGWYRYLGDCQTEAVQAKLTAELMDQALQKRLDKTQWFSLVEVYARNLGAAAIPTLVSLTKSNDEEAVLVNLIGAFADAADVGAAEGRNAEAAAAAVSAIVGLGPSLPPLAVEKARRTLVALGADAQADHAAAWRWADRFDGGYRYAASLAVVATCKNGTTRAELHQAKVAEPGKQWPEQMRADLDEKLRHEWSVESAAAKCKGTATVTTSTPDEPFADEAAREAWLGAQADAFLKAQPAEAKPKVVVHDEVAL